MSCCCFNPCGWFVYQLLQQPVLTLLLSGMVGHLIPRFDALIMRPRQENVQSDLLLRDISDRAVVSRSALPGLMELLQKPVRSKSHKEKPSALFFMYLL